MQAEPVRVEISDGLAVSGLMTAPPRPLACYVMAHGAGAGMAHPFMAAVAAGLAARGIGTLRFQFPYMEQRSKRPDRPPLAHAAIRAAVALAARRWPAVALLAGGKSFGARMTSQAQAEGSLQDVRGLAFFGFPLHPAGKPADERAAHLSDVRVPMLFLQGTRDALAEMTLLRPVIERLGARATLVPLDDADHAFHVRACSGHTDAGTLETALDESVAWADNVVARQPLAG
jgi:predicted alpha/beta-hydrolase family hydrolase